MNKLHRSGVETIAASVLPAPTYDLHVAASSASRKVSESKSMVNFSDHVLQSRCSPSRGLSSTAMEVQAPFGKRCRMKRLTAMHASFIEEALDTLGALPP